jgi:hypothetical protein
MEAVWRFEQRTFYIGSFGYQKVRKRVWPALNKPKLVALHSNSTLPLSMHHMWKEIIDIVCKITKGKS